MKVVRSTSRQGPLAQRAASVEVREPMRNVFRLELDSTRAARSASGPYLEALHATFTAPPGYNPGGFGFTGARKLGEPVAFIFRLKTLSPQVANNVSNFSPPKVRLLTLPLGVGMMQFTRPA